MCIPTTSCVFRSVRTAIPVSSGQANNALIDIEPPSPSLVDPSRLRSCLTKADTQSYLQHL